MAVSHTHDQAGRETVLENRKSTGAALSVYSATYDSVGNRLTVQELDGVRVTYGYDPSYQLMNEQRSGVNTYNVTYSYDFLSNRLVKNDSGSLTSYSYNAANELTVVQPTSGQSTTSSYDANGNLTLDNAGGVLSSFIWDAENRLTTAADATGTETYTYSADGLRKKKATGTGTVILVWDKLNVLIETDVSLVTQAAYTDLPGIWGKKFSLRRSGISRLYLPDNQGNTRQLVDSVQNVTDTLLTDAWGVELANSGSTLNPFKAFGQWGYCRDAGKRLYVQARHLGVLAGRWISVDLLYEKLSQSRYAYVGNNPLVYIDPTGLFGMVNEYGPAMSSHCGEATWVVHWTAKKNDYGSVIQHDTWTWNINTCDNKPKKHKTLEFWEAWGVYDGKLWVGPPPRPPQGNRSRWDDTDVFHIPENDEGTTGCIRVRGVVQFWSGFFYMVGPWGYHDPRFTPPGGDAVTFPPPGPKNWSDNSKGGIVRFMQTCWCCCPDSHWQKLSHGISYL